MLIEKMFGHHDDWQDVRKNWEILFQEIQNLKELYIFFLEEVIQS